MAVDIGSLRKILELEQQKGYPDSAVIGGLDRFLYRWIGQAAGSLNSPKLLTRSSELNLVNPGYASLSQGQRARWVEGVLSFLAELEDQEEEKGKARLVPPASRPAARPR